jgi:hypothetical protein
MEFFKRMNDFLRRANPFRQNGGLEPNQGRGASLAHRSELVKTKPVIGDDRYQINDNDRQVDEVFRRVVSRLVELCEQLSLDARRGGTGHAILRDQGTTDDRRAYLFMKPMNEHGWLLEKSAAGWRLSRAEKIVGQNLFLRSNENPWDLVTLWSDPKGERLMRVRSMRFGQDLLSISEYERRLLDGVKDLLTRGALN